jgi:hypothetical protein
MTRSEARKLAFKNAAGLVNNMDLEQLFGGEYDEDDEALLEEAQAEVVKLLESRAD